MQQMVAATVLDQACKCNKRQQLLQQLLKPWMMFAAPAQHSISLKHVCLHQVDFQAYMRCSVKQDEMTTCCYIIMTQQQKQQQQQQQQQQLFRLQPCGTADVYLHLPVPCVCLHADNSCSQASITFPHNGTTTTTAAADKPDTDEAASEDAQYQAVFSSGLPVAPTNQCAAKYVACTCSMSCCEGLVCGFPIIRGSAFEQQTGTAYEQVPNAQIVNETAAPGSNSSSVVNSSAPGNSTGSKRSALGNSSTISSSSRSLKSDNKQQQQAPALKPDAVHESGSSSLAALGPSCRPLPEVDLVHGVVNYGC
jgi:hypothetical protein